MICEVCHQNKCADWCPKGKVFSELRPIEKHEWKVWKEKYDKLQAEYDKLAKDLKQTKAQLHVVLKVRDKILAEADYMSQGYDLPIGHDIKITLKERWDTFRKGLK